VVHPTIMAMDVTRMFKTAKPKKCWRAALKADDVLDCAGGGRLRKAALLSIPILNLRNDGRAPYNQDFPVFHPASEILFNIRPCSRKNSQESHGGLKKACMS
jgi:hypothetical protein